MKKKVQINPRYVTPIVCPPHVDLPWWRAAASARCTSPPRAPFFSTCLSTCVARAACLVFCPIFITTFWFSFFFFYKFNTHLCHGAYWCTHNPAHMPILLFHLPLPFSNSCICVSKHVYVFPSSSIFIYIYRHIAIFMCMFCVLFYVYNYLFCFLSCCSTNLIDTYVTVPIDVPITLLISLSSASFCISIFVIHAYVCVDLYTHFPPLPYSYKFIAIFICIYVSTIL